MQGYDVVTHEDEKVVGHVVDKVDGNYIVEQGHLRKTKHALPEELATVDEAGQRLVIMVTKDVLSDAPKVNGDVDDDPGLLNSDPYGAGWLMKVRLDNGDAEPAGLLTADEYAELTEDRE